MGILFLSDISFAFSPLVDINPLKACARHSLLEADCLKSTDIASRPNPSGDLPIGHSEDPFYPIRSDASCVIVNLLRHWKEHIIYIPSFSLKVDDQRTV